MDVPALKRVAYELARHINARVVAIHEPRVTPNFITAGLDPGDRSLYLLCSHAGDWALCREVSLDGCRLEFEDSPTIAQVLERNFGIRLHPKASLLGPFVKAPWMCDADTSYWRPRTLGEALFNWWD